MRSRGCIDDVRSLLVLRELGALVPTIPSSGAACGACREPAAGFALACFSMRSITACLTTTDDAAPNKTFRQMMAVNYILEACGSRHIMTSVAEDNWAGTNAGEKVGT